eukprot:1181037-Alexandrium_andersonii.AAC.1
MLFGVFAVLCVCVCVCARAPLAPVGRLWAHRHGLAGGVPVAPLRPRLVVRRLLWRPLAVRCGRRRHCTRPAHVHLAAGRHAARHGHGPVLRPLPGLPALSHGLPCAGEVSLAMHSRTGLSR